MSNIQKKNMEKKNSMSKIFEKVKEFIHKYIVKKEDTKLLEAPKSVEIDKKEGVTAGKL